MKMSGGVSATLINDGIVGEQSGKSAVRAESAGGESGTGWHNQGQWIRNKATLPALAGREGLFRVNTTPYGQSYGPALSRRPPTLWLGGGFLYRAWSVRAVVAS